MAVATRMTVDELGLVLAIYCKLYGADAGAAKRHLDPTPRAHFSEGVAWAEANARVVRLLKDDARSIALKNYSLNPARGWFARTFGLGQGKGVTAPADDEIASVMREIAETKKAPTKKRKDYDKIRALVEQSLDEA